VSPAFLLLMLAAPSTVRGAHVTASLIAEPAWLRPGRTVTVGLRLQMAPEWHTYWKNPGDSGLPTRVRWTLPPGFEAGPLVWPTPERFASEPLASYGYSGEVVLLSEIRTPAAAAGATVEIAARVDWLECREVCRPGKAELALSLAVKAGDPPPDPRFASAFAETRERLPKGRGPWRFEAKSGASRLDLLALGVVPLPREAYFFPSTPSLVEHGEAQTLQAERGGFRLRVPLAPNARQPERVEGVLVADGVGFELAAPVERADPKGGTR
jgi:thiol:disulfide interchange protein DsbD